MGQLGDSDFQGLQALLMREERLPMSSCDTLFRLYFRTVMLKIHEHPSFVGDFPFDSGDVAMSQQKWPSFPQDFVKCGVGIGQDLRLLAAQFGLQSQGAVDLQHLAQRYLEPITSAIFSMLQ